MGLNWSPNVETFVLFDRLRTSYNFRDPHA